MYSNAFHVILSPFNNRLNGPPSFYLYQWQHYHNSTCSQSKAIHVGCVSGKCGADDCAGLYFDPEDYAKWVGEVFQGYRAAGLGEINIGDDAGFYYPKQWQWLQTVRSQTNLAPCPGIPHDSRARHCINSGCWGELFKIMLMGRVRASQLTNWTISWFIINMPRPSWSIHTLIAARMVVYNQPALDNACLLPQPSAYEQCYQYVLAIHKKM